MRAMRSTSDQRKIFDLIIKEAEQLVWDHPYHEVIKFISPFWQNTPKPELVYYFIDQPIIKQTMFVTNGGSWMDKQVKFIEDFWNIDDPGSEGWMQNILEEPHIGGADIHCQKYKCSHNSIHHLYHITNFLNYKNSVARSLFNSVVEWGGGYGNMARIIRGINYQCDYTIIDLPHYCALQYIYLSCFFGPSSVNLVSKNNPKLEGKINIIPINMLDNIDITCDLFISTWALTESSTYSQAFVLDKNIFGAKNLLCAFAPSDGNFPSSEFFVQHLPKAFEKLVCKIPTLTSHYLFGNRNGST